MTSISQGAELPYRRKLIEVDLPLDAINAESAKEKSIRKGHPSTLHIWWSRKPTASCRAVLFTSLVDDPIDCQEQFKTEEEQSAERERLHDIVRRLVRWDSTNETNRQNEELLASARWEIARSVARSRNEPPLDPEDRNAVLAYLNDKFGSGSTVGVRPVLRRRFNSCSGTVGVRPVLRRRFNSTGSPTTWPEGHWQRPQPRGGAYYQSVDRTTLRIPWTTTCKSRV